MKADVFVELPASLNEVLKIGVRKNGKLEEIAASGFKGNAQTQAVAFAPALSVARFQVAVAPKSESDARSAALYAIEDDLAQPVEDVHLTLGPRSRDTAVRAIYVVDKALMDFWSNKLRAMGLGHAPIIPECSLLPPEPVILNFGNRLLLASPTAVAAVDTALPQEAVDALIDAAGLSGVRTVHTNALNYMSTQYADRSGVNLNGSSNQHARGHVATSSPFWLSAAALVFATGAVWIAGLLYETNRTFRAAQQNEVAAFELFRAQFPEAPEPMDIHLEVRRLAQASAPGNRADFRSLSSALYEAISGSQTIRLVSMSYRKEDSTIRAKVQFANSADEASFRTRIESAGYTVEVSQAGASISGLEADVTIGTSP